MIHVKPPSELDPEQALIQREELQRLDRMIDELIPRHAYAIRAHYGINCEPQTYRDIGPKMGVCGQRVRQMVQHGERVLRNRLKRALEQDDPYEYRKKLLSRAEDAKRHAEIERQRKAHLEAEWQADRERHKEACRQREEADRKLAATIKEVAKRQDAEDRRVTAGILDMHPRRPSANIIDPGMWRPSQTFGFFVIVPR